MAVLSLPLVLLDSCACCDVIVASAANDWLMLGAVCDWLAVFALVWSSRTQLIVVFGGRFLRIVEIYQWFSFRDIYEKGMKALVSFVQFYRKHECSLIFRTSGKSKYVIFCKCCLTIIL